MRHKSREDGGSRNFFASDGAARHKEFDSHEEDSDAYGAAVPLLQALLYRQRDELATERAAVKALQTGQSGLDNGCAGGRGDEVQELAERPEAQVRELLHCFICLFLGLLYRCCVSCIG